MDIDNEKYIELPFNKCEYKYSDFKAVRITEELIPLFTKTKCDYFYNQTLLGVSETVIKHFGITGDCLTCNLNYGKYSCESSYLRLVGLIKIHTTEQVYSIYEISPRLGEWVVVGKGGYLEIMDEEQFSKNFQFD